MVKMYYPIVNCTFSILINLIFKFKKSIIMKKVFAFAACLFIFCTLNAQRSMQPLRGNGTSKNVQYDLKDFDMLEILWIDGRINVLFGAPKSDITINTDENIYNLLKVQNTEGVLKLELEGNYKNRLWVEDDKTNITIRTTKQPREIIYKANANANMRGINTDILTIEKDENGGIQLIGKVNQLLIEKSDNGGIDASNLIAQEASIKSTGNGNVDINALKVVKEHVRGNGGLRNVQYATNKMTNVPTKRVSITFFNPSNSKKEYYVTGTNEHGRKFSYGLALSAMGKKQEHLPVGTSIFYKGKNVAILKESDEGQVVKL
jgi:hypothetical protein